MSDRKAKALIIVSALMLITVGLGLYFLFERQGYSNNSGKNIVRYYVDDYVETKPVIFSNYSDFYTSVNVSKVNFINLDNDIVKKFINEENELIAYVDAYYNGFMPKDGYTPNNSVSSNIKTQVNSTVLSVYYEIKFNLDRDLFSEYDRRYFITTNIDLGTGKVMTCDDLLTKYNYSKKYIAEKIFDDDVMPYNGQIVVDRETNISLTKEDVQRKRSEYITRIIDDFDNIIKVYIENESLTLVYDKRVLNSVFFDNEFDTEIKIRYLK